MKKVFFFIAVLVTLFSTTANAQIITSENLPITPLPSIKKWPGWESVPGIPATFVLNNESSPYIETPRYPGYIWVVPTPTANGFIKVWIKEVYTLQDANGALYQRDSICEVSAKLIGAPVWDYTESSAVFRTSANTYPRLYISQENGLVQPRQVTVIRRIYRESGDGNKTSNWRDDRYSVIW